MAAHVGRIGWFLMGGDLMTRAALALVAAAFVLSPLASATAHDTAGHKCKKGYVMTGDHRCVKPRP